MPKGQVHQNIILLQTWMLVIRTKKNQAHPFLVVKRVGMGKVLLSPVAKERLEKQKARVPAKEKAKAKEPQKQQRQ